MSLYSSCRDTWRPANEGAHDGCKLSLDPLIEDEEFRLQNNNDDGGLSLAKIKETYFGKFYLRYLKRYRACRRLSLKVWSLGFRLQRRIKFLSSRVNLAGPVKSQKMLSLGEYCHLNEIMKASLVSPASVKTPRPSVYPKVAESLLVSPHKAYVYPEVFVAILESAIVAGATNLVAAGNKMIHHDLFNIDKDYTSEELHSRIYINTRRAKIFWDRDTEELKIVEKAAVFTDACAFNYAHWITEILPRIALFCREPQYDDIPLIIDASLHENIMDSLYQIVGDRRKVYVLGVDRALSVKKLYTVSVTGYVPFQPRKEQVRIHSHGLFSPDAFRCMKANIFCNNKNAPLESWPERIFLRRNSDIRCLVNANEIEEFLSSRGYAIVEPEKLSFAQQVLLFSNAKIIVGSSGAALANIVFANENAKIFILMGGYENTSFWYWQNIACASGCSVNYVIGQCTKSDYSGIHSDFIVGMDDLKGVIKDSENTL